MGKLTTYSPLALFGALGILLILSLGANYFFEVKEIEQLPGFLRGIMTFLIFIALVSVILWGISLLKGQEPQTLLTIHRYFRILNPLIILAGGMWFLHWALLGHFSGAIWDVPLLGRLAWRITIGFIGSLLLVEGGAYSWWLIKSGKVLKK